MLHATTAEYVSTATIVVRPPSQYRVQVLTADRSNWETYATFRHQPQANECWLRLMLDGHEARIAEHADR